MQADGPDADLRPAFRLPAQAGMLGVVLVLTGIATPWTIAVFSERTRPRLALAREA